MAKQPMKMTREERCAQRKANNVRRLAARRDAAEDRQAERNKLTSKQQLAKLDKLGHRAAKERARLSKEKD